MAFTQQPLTTPPYFVGPDQKEANLTEDIVRDLTDDSHLALLIQAAPGWTQFHANTRQPLPALLTFWREKVRTPGVGRRQCLCGVECVLGVCYIVPFATTVCV